MTDLVVPILIIIVCTTVSQGISMSAWWIAASGCSDMLCHTQFNMVELNLM